MNIKIIDEKEQFAQCETFEITHLLWGTKAIPKTYEMEFVKGLFCKTQCF